jgi:hypothetical protein
MLLKSDLDVQQTNQQKYMLSSNIKCDHIFDCHIYAFGHTVVLLKSDLDVQQTNLWFVEQEHQVQLQL